MTRTECPQTPVFRPKFLAFLPQNGENAIFIAVASGLLAMKDFAYEAYKETKYNADTDGKR